MVVRKTNEYIRTAQPGFSIEEAIEQPTPENAVIVKYESGLRKEYIEWNPLTEHMYSPKPDPRYFKPTKIVMRAGEQILGKEVPPGFLTAGMNPFYQIIFHVIKRGGITSEEDIIRAVLGEERIFSESDEDAIPIIRRVLQKMNEGDYYILRHEGKWKPGFELPRAYHLVEYRRGYDPFEYHIMQFVEGRDIVSLDEIYRYIIEYLGWLKTPSKVDYYLEKLLRGGNLMKVQQNFFKFRLPLESNK